MKQIKNLRICDSEKYYEEDVWLSGTVELKNAKLKVNGTIWIARIESGISIENSIIVADRFVNESTFRKYENSKIIQLNATPFDTLVKEKLK